MALDEAIDRAVKIYEKEHLHPAPTDAVAQHMGYKNANNGAALSAMASLRYFGLLDRPADGKLAVTKDVESYMYAPSEDIQQALRIKWLRTPPVFAELLDSYQGALPSDANLRFGLIQKGFLPASAESAISIFRRSVEFARYFEAPLNASSPKPSEFSAAASSDAAPAGNVGGLTSGPSGTPPAQLGDDSLPEMDRIPVRLSGGRRAWLVIPEVFYAADKDRLKAQIDLLLTQDEEDLA